MFIGREGASWLEESQRRYMYVARSPPAPIFRCVHYFALYFSLVILEVLFTHPSKQSSGRHLFPLLKESLLKRQIVQYAWLGSLENVVLQRSISYVCQICRTENSLSWIVPEDKMREIDIWMFIPWMTQDGDLIFALFFLNQNYFYLNNLIFSKEQITNKELKQLHFHTS